MVTRVGAPDWQPPVPQSGQQKIVILEAIVNGGVFESPVFYAGDYPNLFISYNSNAVTGLYFVQIAWWTDESESSQVVTQSFSLQGGGQGGLSFPVITAWASVNISNLNDPSGGEILVSVFATNSNARSLKTSQPGAPLLTGQLSVAANGSHTDTATTIYAGPATLAVVHGTNKAWFATLQFFGTVLASWVNMLQLNAGQPAEFEIERITIPPAPIRLIIGNQDTSAQTMYWSLTADD